MTGRSVVGLLVGRNLGRSVGRSGSGLVWYGSGLVAVGIWVGLFFRPFSLGRVSLPWRGCNNNYRLYYYFTVHNAAWAVGLPVRLPWL